MSDSYTPASSPRLCPDCKVPLERIRDAWTLAPSASLFADDIVVDVYSCPQCGLVRLYSFEQRWKQEAAAKAAEQPQPREPVSTDPWEKKGFFGRKKDKPDWES